MWFSGSDAADTLSATPPTGSFSAGGETDTDAGIEAFKLSGARGNDTVTTGSSDDELYGGEGNDVLSAGGGDDLLAGDEPTDSAPNHDQLDGGAGDDFLLPYQGERRRQGRACCGPRRGTRGIPRSTSRSVRARARSSELYPSPR